MVKILLVNQKQDKSVEDVFFNYQLVIEREKKAQTTLDAFLTRREKIGKTNTVYYVLPLLYDRLMFNAVMQYTPV